MVKTMNIITNQGIKPLYITKRPIGQMSKVFANGQGDNPRSSHTKDSKNGT